MIAMLALYNVYGLSLQRCVSGCLVLLLFMSCYLITIDEVTLFNELQDIAIVESGFIFLYNLQNSVLFNNSIKNDFSAIGDSLKEQKLISFDYLVVISLAIMGLMLMCSSNDLLTSYLTMELFSLACYILASFLKSPSYAIIAGIKYFITGSVASVFFCLEALFYIWLQVQQIF
jgi:NADH-quinone oxidoreductase subunit N